MTSVQMQLTAAVVILTTLLSLLIDGRLRAAAISFLTVMFAHLAIHLGPRWLVFSVIAREIGGFLKHLSRDPTSSVLAMLAAAFVGWMLALVLRGAFSDEPRGDWDPDRPRAGRRRMA